MKTTCLTDALNLHHDRDVTAGTFDAAWLQGRGVYGGLVAAVTVAALQHRADGVPVRALSLHLCAPAAPGPFEVHTRAERVGSRVQTWSARLHCGDDLAAVGVAAVGTEQVTDLDGHPGRPQAEMPDPGSLESEANPFMPPYTRQFEYRIAYGVPMTGQAEARTGGWVRFRAPTELDARSIVALLDCWPLAVLPTMVGPRPVASVAIDFQVAPPPYPDVDWLRVEVEGTRPRDGYCDQIASLYAGDVLVGRARQLAAILA